MSGHFENGAWVEEPTYQHHTYNYPGVSEQISNMSMTLGQLQADVRQIMYEISQMRSLLASVDMNVWRLRG